MNDSISAVIKKIGWSNEHLAEYLDVSTRTLHRWEVGESEPSKIILQTIESLAEATGLKKGSKMLLGNSLKFIDLFAGIGGIRTPFDKYGECVFSSEWDKYSKETYAANFKVIPEGDITKIPASKIPSHDLLLAGFPCQAFSQAGLKQGFLDTRGTMFFEVQRILAYHRPKAFILENVKQLKGHDKGRTLKTILDILRGINEGHISDNIPMSDEARKSFRDKLNYCVDFKVLRAGDFGVPQNRERIFIVGIDRDAYPNIELDELFKWPEPTYEETRLGDILFNNPDVDPKYTISDKLWAGHQRRKQEHKNKGNGFGYSLFNHDSPYANTISARYYKDGSEILIDQSDLGLNPRKLTPRECARLQGFSDDFIIERVSNVQAYKQFGNSVSVPVVRAVAESLMAALGEADRSNLTIAAE